MSSEVGQRSPEVGQRSRKEVLRSPEVGQRSPEEGQWSPDVGQRWPEVFLSPSLISPISLIFTFNFCGVLS